MKANPDHRYSVDVASSQVTKHRKRVCGDTFLFRRIKEEGRLIAVLSDGLGSGIKANVLSTLTATMALNYTAGFHDLRKSAETIMETLPVCSERGISYATFAIVDIDAAGEVRIINYDNPPPIVIRNGVQMDVETLVIEGTAVARKYRVTLGSFKLTFGDRIILFSDGVSQAGMGSRPYPLGWGNADVGDFVETLLKIDGKIPARTLAKEIVGRALEIDLYTAHDDTSCAVVHYRRSRELLIVTGPPVKRENDVRMARTVATFPGKKIVCGGTTAKIIGRELGREITFRMDDLLSNLPPVSHMEGIDLVTEGIITLHAVEELLKSGLDFEAMQPSPARDIVRLMVESDCIHMLIGTRINEAWQDPELPDDLGLRRTTVSAIMRLLETVHQKETKLTFV